MDYIVGASNLRAENYGIAAADRHQVTILKLKFLHAIIMLYSVVVVMIIMMMERDQEGEVRSDSPLPLGHVFSLCCTHLP